MLLALAALAIPGCGGDDDEGGGGSAGSPPASAASTTVVAYLHATAEGDGKTACSHLTEKARGFAAQVQGAKANTCEGVIAEAAGRMKDEYRGRLRRVSAADVDVSVKGETATAEVARAKATAGLVREGDRWLIDTLSTGP